ncbi:hypothetical protein CBR_g70548 [Chara braunii]|uniref:Uncharacterized protein n=1 Tax=Chara braunii TaxID=69332 RepID=A0A388MFX3_CHABU|nr:hypothetical protein CBR_g70548 [Chara braunii]|eukprot:GBG93450.1 hypothetical protein CBR_g70548 [Chara braunii]
MDISSGGSRSAHEEVGELGTAAMVVIGGSLDVLLTPLDPYLPGRWSQQRMTCSTNSLNGDTRTLCLGFQKDLLSNRKCTLRRVKKFLEAALFSAILSAMPDCERSGFAE